MSVPRTNTEGRHAAIERVKQALREERSFNKMIAEVNSDIPGAERPGEDESEDNLINLLLTLGPQYVHDCMRRVFRRAMFCCLSAPTAEENAHLCYLDDLCLLVEKMAAVQAADQERVEELVRKQKKGKRTPRGVKVSDAREVEEDLVQALFDWGFPTTLAALRTAERRVMYYSDIEPTSEILGDLIILRAVIDKIEAFGWAVKMMRLPEPKEPIAASC